MRRRAVFFDRDGVLVRDMGPSTTFDSSAIFPEAAEAVATLTAAGFLNVIVTNQTVISRGLLTPDEVDKLHARLVEAITVLGGSVDGVYVCPHHPEATLEAYRINCSCRKPAPGMLLQAAADMDIDLTRSFIIGDRISDIVAGHRAGTRTVLLETGRHEDKLIRSSEWPDVLPEPDFTCANLLDAVRFILEASA